MEFYLIFFQILIEGCSLIKLLSFVFAIPKYIYIQSTQQVVLYSRLI